MTDALICRTNLPYRDKVENLRHGDHVKIMDGGACDFCGGIRPPTGAS